MSGASGPSAILKQLSNNAWALSSATFKFWMEAKLFPVAALAHTTPTVKSFTAPGSKVKGPADCKNLLSDSVLGVPPACALNSLHEVGVAACPNVLQFNGSESPGNNKSAGMVPPDEGCPLPPHTICAPSLQMPFK